MVNHAETARTVFQSQFPNSRIESRVRDGKLDVEVYSPHGNLIVTSTRPLTETAEDRERFEGELFTTAKWLKQQVIEQAAQHFDAPPVQLAPVPKVEGAL